jgi:hypothetical protein
MRNLTLPLLLTLVFAGCGGQFDDGGDSADAIKRIAPPAPTYVAWQFLSCLTADQRIGLVAALQQIHQQEVPELLPSVGESVCGTDGQERGALFPSTTSEAGRQRTLAILSIRPLSSSYTFMISTTAMNAVANNQWSRYIIPSLRRFDDAGVASASGRYQVSNYEVDVATSLATAAKLHVVDTQTQLAVDLVRAGTLYVPSWLSHAGQVTQNWQNWVVSPSSSSDPLVQTIINAAEKYLNAAAGNVDSFNPIDEALDALDFPKAPSLKGWALPFDSVTVDAAGDVYGSGGTLIQ